MLLLFYFKMKPNVQILTFFLKQCSNFPSRNIPAAIWFNRPCFLWVDEMKGITKFSAKLVSVFLPHFYDKGSAVASKWEWIVHLR